MAWSGSSIFRAYVTDLVEGTVENAGATSMDWSGATTVKAALFPTGTTPDNDVASASSAYNTGVWTSGTELSDGTNWDAGGEPLTGRGTTNPAGDIIMLDATDTPQSGATCTLSGVFGTLIYSDSIATPVAKQGFCYLYFGGSQSVTAGTFTIVYHANGVMRWTVTQA